MEKIIINKRLLNAHPLKPGVGQNITMHGFAHCHKCLLFLISPFRSIKLHLFQILSLFFLFFFFLRYVWLKQVPVHARRGIHPARRHKRLMQIPVWSAHGIHTCKPRNMLLCIITVNQIFFFFFYCFGPVLFKKIVFNTLWRTWLKIHVINRPYKVWTGWIKHLPKQIYASISATVFQETETCMVWTCRTPRQPLQNYPSGHRGGWATPWSAEKTLAGQHQRVDMSALARTAHKGFLQKRLEEDLCWIVPHVPRSRPNRSRDWTELTSGNGMSTFKLNAYYHHAKFNIYYIHGVPENRNVKVFYTSGHSASRSNIYYIDAHLFVRVKN